MPPVSKELLDWQAKQKVKETWYDTKTIGFFGRSTPIILQNTNGPCPLLAVCNILSLRNKLGLNPYATCVSERKLLTLVAESLFDSNSKAEDAPTVADAIGLLPLLAKGLDVNVRFTRIQDIEFTTECAVFGLLDIPVYHGWLIDPEYSETSNAIGSKSYNTLMSDLVDLANRNTKAVSMKSSEEDCVEHVEKEYIGEEHEPLVHLELTKNVDPSSANFGGDQVNFENNPNKASHDGQMKTSKPERRESKDGIEEDSIEVVKKTVKSDGDYSGPRIRYNDESLAFGKTKINEASSSSANAVLESSIEMTEIESHPLTARQGELVRDFFKNNKTQLTEYGLSCLQEGLEDRELCVFFRNNHFSTILKYEGTLYTLVTDIGYQHKPSVIWEKLSEVNGNTVYVNNNFEIYKPEIESSKKLTDASHRTDYTEAEASTDTNLSSDPQLAEVFQQLVLKRKHAQQEPEEKQPRRVSSAPFPTRSNVCPKHEHSIWPRNPSRKPSRKELKSKRWKEKCSLM